MKRYAPDYYREFACIADKCRHSCCVGWEIDIDESTLADYRRVTGEMGEKLRDNIERTGNTACFRLTENERCPFLLANGLCELILTLGEDSLCHICKSHPRFYNFFSAREEVGIGLCCEEAARLILHQEGITEICLIDDDGESEILWEEEETLLALRDRLFRILQDRALPLDRRIERAFASVGVQPVSVTALPQLLDTLDSLEQLDPAWKACLSALREPHPEKDISHLELPLEKAMLYFIYRHLADAEDETDFAARLRFAHLGVLILAALAKATALPIEELARLYSSEIEYSEENTETLLTLLRNA